MTHFVYPYIIPKDPIFGWELLMSFRSIYKHFKGPFDITLIGEIPNWVDTTIVKAIQFDNNDYGLRVQSKTNQKLLLAAEMYPDIVMMHDDFYLVNNCTKEDFMEIRYISDKSHYTKDTTNEIGLTRFQRQIRWTHLKLKDKGISANHNFCTHAPFYFESEKLRIIHKEFNLTNEGEYSIIVENAYYNYFKPELKIMPIGNYRIGFWGSGKKEPNGNLKKAKILNHDEQGYLSNPWIISFLHQKFNHRCPAERR